MVAQVFAIYLVVYRLASYSRWLISWLTEWMAKWLVTWFGRVDTGWEGGWDEQ